MQTLDQSLANSIAKLKAEYVNVSSGRTFLTEVLPLSYSPAMPIDSSILQSLHTFAKANEIYTNSFDRNIGAVSCRVYEADINGFWLSSKKHDSCYQPFYPTWLLSAFALAYGAKMLGFKELVDIGSGDGRIAFCGDLIGMRSCGIEIDPDLVTLQKSIAMKTGASYAIELADAVRYDYDKLRLSKPIFFVSGLPEMGEMLARSVLGKILADPKLNDRSGFNFMGSHTPKRLSRDHTGWGWGELISEFNLSINGVMTLPTYWTTEQPVDTAYVYATAT